MKKIFLCAAYSCMVLLANAQNVGINNTDPKSALDINGGLRLRQQSTNVTGTTVQLASNLTNHLLTGSPTGDFDISFSGTIEMGQHLIITNSTTFNGLLPQIVIPPNITAEFTYSGINWQLIGSNEVVTNSAWGLFGNEAAVGAKLGHTDNRAIQFISNDEHVGRLGGNNNILLGLRSGNNLSQIASPGSYKNIAIGDDALKTSSSATYNIAIGHNAMADATGGGTGIAIGGSALNKQAPGALENIAIGYSSQAATTSGSYNISVGRQSLFKNTTGSENVAQGASSLEDNTTGSTNVAMGNSSAAKNTTGYSNVAIGASALFKNTIKRNLVAIGDSALYNNGEGAIFDVHATRNTAVGSKSLFRNSTGYSNSAFGSGSLSQNTIGTSNTAIGDATLRQNTIGHSNTAVGAGTLAQNTFGINNTSIGAVSMLANTTGGYNSAVGQSAMLGNEDGSYNSAIGYETLSNNAAGSNNVALGIRALKTNYSGHSNVAVGPYAGYFETSSHKLYIENSDASKDNTLIYGDFAADSILLNAKTINRNSFNIRGNNPLEMGYGTPSKQTDAGKICYGCFGDPAHWLGIVGGGTNALGSDRVIKLWSEGGLRVKGNALPDADNFYTLGSSGQRWKEVWTNAGAINTSDARLKTNIVISPYGLDEVMKMQPVQYNWKTNPNNDLQIGFLAQEIQKIIPEAVVVPANGDPLGMKYNELIPVLVKGMQEQQKIIENQQKKMELQQKQIDELYKLLKAKQ